MCLRDKLTIVFLNDFTAACYMFYSGEGDSVLCDYLNETQCKKGGDNSDPDLIISLV